MANPTILVLDEATSSIDSFSEELIQRATERVTKDKTSIVIAHRLATIKSRSNCGNGSRGNCRNGNTRKSYGEKEGCLSKII